MKMRNHKRILIVDDESDICFALEQFLDENGFVAESRTFPLIDHAYELLVD